MEEPEVSEKYRKYVTRLEFKDLSGYVIWGTDMYDNATDTVFA